MVVGTTNTGKTTLCCRMTKHMLTTSQDPRSEDHQKAGPFKQLIIVSPNFARDEQLKKLALFASHKKIFTRVYKDFTNKNAIDKFVDSVGASADQGIRTLIYFDDPVGLSGLTSNVNQRSSFNSMVSGLKHYKASMIFSTQSIGSMSRSARKNMEVFVWLPDMASRDEHYKACRFVPTQNDFNKLMDVYAGEPYHALWINTQFGKRGVFSLKDTGQITPVTSVPR